MDTNGPGLAAAQGCVTPGKQRGQLASQRSVLEQLWHHFLTGTAEGKSKLSESWDHVDFKMGRDFKMGFIFKYYLRQQGQNTHETNKNVCHVPGGPCNTQLYVPIPCSPSWWTSGIIEMLPICQPRGCIHHQGCITTAHIKPLYTAHIPVHLAPYAQKPLRK